MSHRNISKTMSYLLRHDTEGMDIDHEGWVPIPELLERLQKRNLNADRDQLRTVVEQDPKGRYELKAEQIRARYGHSIDGIDPTLTPANREELFHGTSPDVVDQICSEGLQKQGRQKVHLSTSVDEARSVGRRHTNQPVILTVDAKGAQENGTRIERASPVVYVADEIPPEFITRWEGDPNGTTS